MFLGDTPFDFMARLAALIGAPNIARFSQSENTSSFIYDGI
jgi:hypothetical protein